MRLLIKQRVFSWTDSYDVYDENENPKYFVKAEFFSLGHQLHVYDSGCLPFFRPLKSRSVAGSVVKSANSFLFSSPDMRSTITAGAWREIFWDGIMMYTMDAAVSSISLKNCFTGEIRILLISPIHRMNWRV
jgi:hypothetical protein